MGDFSIQRFIATARDGDGVIRMDSDTKTKLVNKGSIRGLVGTLLDQGNPLTRGERQEMALGHFRTALAEHYGHQIAETVSTLYGLDDDKTELTGSLVLEITEEADSFAKNQQETNESVYQQFTSRTGDRLPDPSIEAHEEYVERFSRQFDAETNGGKSIHSSKAERLEARAKKEIAGLTGEDLRNISQAREALVRSWADFMKKAARESEPEVLIAAMKDVEAKLETLGALEQPGRWDDLKPSEREAMLRRALRTAIDAIPEGNNILDRLQRQFVNDKSSPLRAVHAIAVEMEQTGTDEQKAFAGSFMSTCGLVLGEVERELGSSTGETGGDRRRFVDHHALDRDTVLVTLAAVESELGPVGLLSDFIDLARQGLSGEELKRASDAFDTFVRSWVPPLSFDDCVERFGQALQQANIDSDTRESLRGVLDAAVAEHVMRGQLSEHASFRHVPDGLLWDLAIPKHTPNDTSEAQWLDEYAESGTLTRRLGVFGTMVEDQRHGVRLTAGYIDGLHQQLTGKPLCNSAERLYRTTTAGAIHLGHYVENAGDKLVDHGTNPDDGVVMMKVVRTDQETRQLVDDILADHRARMRRAETDEDKRRDIARTVQAFARNMVFEDDRLLGTILNRLLLDDGREPAILPEFTTIAGMTPLELVDLIEIGQGLLHQPQLEQV